MPYSTAEIEHLIHEVLKGNVLSLSRAITLLESRLESDLEAQQTLMENIMSATGRSMRIAVTGPPGVGKSSCIDLLGCSFIEAGKKVAVLAVDPSSERTKGSILGDKTRMVNLARSNYAYIRPSPSGLEPGGVRQSTRASMLLCEAAGYDVVFIETVGAGQNEFYAHHISDILMLLLPTQAGDEVQGIKRGIMEMAHIYVVNKADGANLPKAILLKKELEAILPYLSKDANIHSPDVITFSTLDKTGLTELVQCLNRRFLFLKDSGMLYAIREEQSKRWLDDLLYFRIMEKIKKQSFSNQSKLEEFRSKMRPDVYPGRWVEEILKNILL